MSATFLFLVVVTVLALLLSSTSITPVTANQPRSPFHAYCRHRINDICWRYVLHYEQHLSDTRVGKELIGLLRQVRGGRDTVEASPEVSKRIHELLHTKVIEDGRQVLHKRSNEAFACVDEFERKAAGDIPEREWQKPATFERDPNEFDDTQLQQPEDHDPSHRFATWAAIREEEIHPENYFH